MYTPRHPNKKQKHTRPVSATLHSSSLLRLQMPSALRRSFETRISPVLGGPILIRPSNRSSDSPSALSHSSFNIFYRFRILTPRSQPGLWCDWTPSQDELSIEWNRAEKFRNYEEWFIYIVDRILMPRGYVLNGRVRWHGEDPDDSEFIEVVDKQVHSLFV